MSEKEDLELNILTATKLAYFLVFMLHSQESSKYSYNDDKNIRFVIENTNRFETRLIQILCHFYYVSYHQNKVRKFRNVVKNSARLNELFNRDIDIRECELIDMIDCCNKIVKIVNIGGKSVEIANIKQMIEKLDIKAEKPNAEEATEIEENNKKAHEKNDVDMFRIKRTDTINGSSLKLMTNDEFQMVSMSYTYYSIEKQEADLEEISDALLQNVDGSSKFVFHCLVLQVFANIYCS